MIRIGLPTPLQHCISSPEITGLTGRTVHDLLVALADGYPVLRGHLFDGDGRLRSFVHAYLNGREIDRGEEARTPVGEDDFIRIVPSIEGGTSADGSARNREDSDGALGRSSLPL